MYTAGPFFGNAHENLNPNPWVALDPLKLTTHVSGLEAWGLGIRV